MDVFSYIIMFFSKAENSYWLMDLVLPFLIVFSIAWLAIKKSKVFKDHSRAETMIALVVGLGVVLPHIWGVYPAGSDVVEMMKQFLPNIAIVVVVAIVVMILLGMIGVGHGWGEAVHGIAVVISIAIVGIIFARSYGIIEADSWWLQWLKSPNTYSFLVVIISFGLIIWFVSRKENSVF